ncbi:MAG: cation:proton antiporter [Candidatus Omnitrophota bacterium]
MKTTRYFIGALLLLATLGILLFYPLQILIYPNLPLLGILKRGMGIILLSAFLCLYRVLRGPNAADRIVGMDMLGILIVGICAILSITTKRSWYMDIGIAWALQSFISTIAFTKFLEGKDFDE